MKSLFRKIMALFPIVLIEQILISRFGYNILSYSQYGEDMVLRNLFSKQKIGFYVDIGAHHPTKFSNTYWLYRKGWRGINIDAMPGSMSSFEKIRPRDINIETAISSSDQEVVFHIFDKSAFNTLSKSVADKNISSGQHEIRQVIIKPKTLKHILDCHLPQHQKIDFMTIDVEGLDLNVLESNNWDKYVPKIILVEDHGFDVNNPHVSKLYSFLEKKEYYIYSFIEKTLIFIHK